MTIESVGMSRTTAIKPKPTANTPARKAGATRSFRTYRSALNYLNNAVNYERTPPPAGGAGGINLGRIQRLLAALENPHRRFRSVHIVGSKGKGSTVAMLTGMLGHSGFKVGAYTSPHVVDVRERVAVEGKQISESAFTRLMNQVAEAAKKPRVGSPTYFEIMTALAFLYFAEEGVDMAVVETGLGGRYDATNVIKPEVVGVTSISHDHTAILGDTLEAITEEKAGTIKPGIPVVSSPQPPEVDMVLRRVASENDCSFRMTGKENTFSFRFESSRGLGPHTRICLTTETSRFEHVHAPLAGDHQALNCALALGIIDALKNRGFEVDDRQAVEGLANVSLPGRMELICDDPRIMVDGAHNAASVNALMRAIGQNVPYDSMVIIFGCQKDKDITGMLQHVRLGADKVIFTTTGSPRSADPVRLAAQFGEMSHKMCQVADDLDDALSIATRAVTRDDLICITGSFYLIGRAKRMHAGKRKSAR